MDKKKFEVKDLKEMVEDASFAGGARKAKIDQDFEGRSDKKNGKRRAK